MLRKILVLTPLVISSACGRDLPEVDQTLSAGDLATRYKYSKTEVRRKYDGKEITVRGYAVVDAVMPGANESEGLIALEDRYTTGTSQLLCWFSRQAAADFSKIQGDQHVIVKGIFNGKRSMELRACELVELRR